MRFYTVRFNNQQVEGKCLKQKENEKINEKIQIKISKIVFLNVIQNYNFRNHDETRQ